MLENYPILDLMLRPRLTIRSLLRHKKISKRYCV